MGTDLPGGLWGQREPRGPEEWAGLVEWAPHTTVSGSAETPGAHGKPQVPGAPRLKLCRCRHPVATGDTVQAAPAPGCAGKALSPVGLSRAEEPHGCARGAGGRFQRKQEDCLRRTCVATNVGWPRPGAHAAGTDMHPTLCRARAELRLGPQGDGAVSPCASVPQLGSYCHAPFYRQGSRASVRPGERPSTWR